MFQMILFFREYPMHSGIANTTRVRPRSRTDRARSTPDKTAFQTLAATQSVPSMPSETGVVKPNGQYTLLQYTQQSAHQSG